MVEICTEKNKLAYLVREPMKDYIKKKDLPCLQYGQIYIKDKEVYVKTENDNLSLINLNQLNMISDKMVDSLYFGLLKLNALDDKI